MTRATTQQDNPRWNGIGLVFLATLARGLAIFFGAFSLLNVLGEMRIPHFDANIWWIDLHGLPAPAARLLLGAAGSAWLAFGLCPKMASWRRGMTLLLTLLLLGAAVANTATFYQLLRACRKIVVCRLFSFGLPPD